MKGLLGAQFSLLPSEATASAFPASICGARIADATIAADLVE